MADGVCWRSRVTLMCGESFTAPMVLVTGVSFEFILRHETRNRPLAGIPARSRVARTGDKNMTVYEFEVILDIEEAGEDTTVNHRATLRRRLRRRRLRFVRG